MSFKQLNELVANDAYQGGTATTLSAVSDITFLDQISYQITVTGSATGTYTILVSNNFDILKNTGTFVATSSTLALTSGSFPGSLTSQMLNISNWNLPYKFCKLQYVNASGSGTFDATLNSKGI